MGQVAVCSLSPCITGAGQIAVCSWLPCFTESGSDRCVFTVALFYR